MILPSDLRGNKLPGQVVSGCLLSLIYRPRPRMMVLLPVKAEADRINASMYACMMANARAVLAARSSKYSLRKEGTLGWSDELEICQRSSH
jgi:hypothetical protein